jgi:hypothetical protein
MDLSTISIIVTMMATVVIAWYAAASYRLASEIQNQDKNFYSIGIYGEISKMHCELKQIKDDLEIRIKQKHLREKIKLPKIRFNNNHQIMRIKEKRELIKECYRAMEDFDQLIKDYNNSYDDLEKVAIVHSESMKIIVNSPPDTAPGNYDSISPYRRNSQEKLEKIPSKLDEILKVLDNYLS